MKPCPHDGILRGLRLKLPAVPIMAWSSVRTSEKSFALDPLSVDTTKNIFDIVAEALLERIYIQMTGLVPAKAQCS